MMDSARKEARNRQWDKAIGEARADVEAAELDQERRIASLAAADQQSPTLFIRTCSQSKRLVRYRDPRHKWWHLLDWAAQEEKQRVRLGLDHLRGVPLDLLQNLNDSQLQELSSNQKLFAQFYGGENCSECTGSFPSRAYSKKKMRSMEWSLLKLVLKLLFISSEKLADLETRPTPSGIISRAVSWERERWKDSLEETGRRLELLRAEDEQSDLYENFPSPVAPRFTHSPNQREDELHSLNMKLQADLMTLTSENPDDLSAICSQLLLLHIAPDIDTYNVLLIRFCQLNRTPLVHAVLDSMMETHVRPNEITHAALLRFYSYTNNVEGFRRYRFKMDGWERGLALADPSRDTNFLVSSQYHWTWNGKISVKARMNKDVYTSIIVGSLKLRNRGVAKKNYERMVREGWQPTIEILEAILRDCCLGDKDLNSGLAVWKLLLGFQDRGHRISQSAYNSMMELCDSAFNMVLKEVQAFEDFINSIRIAQKMHYLTVKKHKKRRGKIIRLILSLAPPALEKPTSKAFPLGMDLIVRPPDQPMEVLVISDEQDIVDNFSTQGQGTAMLGVDRLEHPLPQDVQSDSGSKPSYEPVQESWKHENSCKNARFVDVEAWARSNPQLQGLPSTWAMSKRQEPNTGANGRLLLTDD